jgi:hypothetical protein
MPLRDFHCPACDLDVEHYFARDPAEAVCDQCHGPLLLLPLSFSRAAAGKTGVFPYTTTHLDGHGTPITIESLGHLRSLERRYGVVVHAFSQDSVDSPRDLPRHRVGGRDYEG